MPMMGFPGQQRLQSPGRPNADPELQKQRDRLSAVRAAVDEMLPKQAKEARFHIYRLVRRNGTWLKVSSKPIAKIYLSEWSELGLKESDTLREHLKATYGVGSYQITCCDAHSNPISQVPSWTEDLYQHGDDFMNDDLGSRGGRRSRGRFSRGGRGRDMDIDPRDLDLIDDRFDDDDLDDYYPEPRGGRGSGIMDFIETTKSGDKAAAAAAVAAATASAQSQNDTMKMILLTSQQQRDADDRRRSEETARQDRAREERRVEDNRLEERRREERKEEETRRAEERRVDREREDRRATERQQTLAGIITAAVSVLPGLLSPKKDDTMGVLLAKLVEPKPQDPIMLTLITKMLEGSNQKGGLDAMLEGMVKMQAVGTEIQAKQMTGMMQTQQDLQAKLMTQILTSAKASGDEGVFDKIIKALPALAPLLAAANQQPAAAPAVQPRPIAATQPQVAPAQPATIAPQAPAGYDVVARAIIALHQKQYTTETERQQIMDALAQNAPHELKVAIAQGDQTTIISLCTPTFTSNTNYMAWLQVEGALDFIMATAAGLQPMFAQQLGVILEPVVPPPAPEATVTQVQQVPVDAKDVEQVAPPVVATAVPDLG